MRTLLSGGKWNYSMVKNTLIGSAKGPNLKSVTGRIIGEGVTIAVVTASRSLVTKIRQLVLLLKEG